MEKQPYKNKLDKRPYDNKKVKEVNIEPTLEDVKRAAQKQVDDLFKSK